MKNIISFTLAILWSSICLGQEFIGPEKDLKLISSASEQFSELAIKGDAEGLAILYTEDAKLFPNGVDIIQGYEEIKKYWEPSDNYSITYHKVSPLKVEVIGKTAIDHGYYEGVSVAKGEAPERWRGKYVITWKKVDGAWKIDMDIWNGIRPEQELSEEVPTDSLETSEPKVTGIGGIFFKADDPKALREWYGKHLGLVITDWGSPFEFRNANRPEERNYLSWGAFPNETEYFAPSKKALMVNYRVQNIEELIEKLRASEVTIVDEIETFDYGKFVHIMDLEGNKIELWEPIDSYFTEMGGETTK